jgi:hypothetical protein
MLPLIYTIDVDGTPTVAFEARQLREVIELCKVDEWMNGERKISWLRSQGYAK